ncbi:hypothetical protein [Agromyces larvae]|uniref:LPXTG cell wall anchor domain-containing protein n=1 Tax=Agromyces larvae TaxID=2929802 RepID=A0ABY4C1H9_9MICO|nr:hypothetical protein [Agromyces larvae]UOE43813.1 hypothetical protein MTO99_16840 [Agromyces larvae]
MAATLIGVALATGTAMPASAAAAAPLVFELHFADLVPGESQTESASFTLPRAGDLVGFEWLDREGVMVVVDLDAAACDPSGACTDLDPLASPVPFAAGTVEIRVTATMTRANPASTGSVVGRLTFTGQDPAPGPLGPTGVDALMLALWAAAAASVGAVVFRLRRPEAAPARSGERRNDERQNDEHRNSERRNDERRNDEGPVEDRARGGE